MSSVTIVVFILVGIVALFLIGYINHLLEKSKLDKARRKAELIDRYRRCATLSSTLPGQLMTVELKQLLNRLELHFVDELTRVDRQEPKHQVRAEELRQLMAKTADVPISNPAVKIMTDEQAKDVRFQLETLQTQIIRAAQEKILPNAQAKQWLSQVRHMLVAVYIEYFNNVGRQQLELNRPNQARLVFERAVQYLKKQKDPAPYKQHLAQFEQLLEQANAATQTQLSPQAAQASELTEGLELQDKHEDWKKKQMYD